MAKPTTTYRVRGPLAELTLARIRELTREPEALFWVFVFPILLTAILGLAFRSRPPEALPVAVVEGPLADPQHGRGEDQALDVQPRHQLGPALVDLAEHRALGRLDLVQV